MTLTPHLSFLFQIRTKLFNAETVRFLQDFSRRNTNTYSYPDFSLLDGSYIAIDKPIRLA